VAIPGKRTKEEVIKDFRTTEIVQAARRVIAESGFDDASMERIAAEAGISKGTIYLYFRNKEELLAQVAQHGFEELMERAKQATGRARTAQAKLVGLSRAAIEHTAENREMFRVIQERSQFGFRRESLLGRTLEENRESLVQHVAAIVAAGAEHGEIRACDHRRVARFLIEILRGALIDRVQTQSHSGVDRDAEAIVDFFLHGVGAEGRP
jgi:AcrR family transcriptional regulator